MILLYHCFRLLYLASARVLSFWQPKAAKWLHGRKHWQAELVRWRSLEAQAPVIWMHCASLGEFEQGRPLAEALKADYPHHRLVISFFSPSGWEAAHRSGVADHYVYLPFDGAVNARRFIDILQPRLAVFVKYEFWHFYLHALQRRKIPTLLIAAVFRDRQPFFRWWGGFYREMLGCFTHVFTQDQHSYQLLEKVLPPSQRSCSGDTRFDRVTAIAAKQEVLPLISNFCKQGNVMVAGSTWREDEELLHQWHAKALASWKLILVPHETDSAHLQALKSLFGDAVFYSTCEKEADLAPHRVLIIDTIGLLSRVYRYATACYVGGGFTRDGIHNLAEAAVYGKVIFSGPEYGKYREAHALKKAGAYFPVENAEALQSRLEITDTTETGLRAAAYIKENSGATGRIMDWIQEKRLLTSA